MKMTSAEGVGAMHTIKSSEQITLPPGKFVCPICGAAVVLEDVEAWVENDAGEWVVDDTGLSINCETEPDIESDEWDDWHNGHWSMPYVDWLPLTMRVVRWVNRHYRWDFSGPVVEGVTNP